MPNHDQADIDHDGLGDACDDDPLFPADAATARTPLAFSDIDHDGIIDLSDNCPTIPNREQADLDLDGYGDVCDEDLEADGVLNAMDNCPTLANPRQEDRDLDGTGDACQLSPPAAGPRSTPVQPAASAPTPATGLGLWLAPLWAAVIAALLRLAQWLLGPAIIVLFSRLQKSSLLEHPVRDWILQQVTAQPGIHFRQLVRDSTSGRGALAHHLRVLRIAGLVREERVGNAVHYYLPTAAPDAGAVKLRSLLRSELARCVAGLVVATPGLPVPELATACGAKYGAVAYHLQRLAQAGAIEVRKEGGVRKAYPVSPDLARLVSG